MTTSRAPAWLLPASVATWLIAFAVVVAVRSWLLLLVVGPILAALRLALDPAARATLRPRTPHVLLGVVGGVLMAAVTHALYRVAVSLVPALTGATADLYALMATTGRDAVILAALITLIVISEEIIFRAHVPFGGTLRAVPAASLLYAAAHLTSQDPLLVVVALCCGVVWTAARVLTGALIAPLLIHLVWDLVIMVVMPLPV